MVRYNDHDDEARTTSTLAWLGWSFPVGRLMGSELRVSWTLLVTVVFETVRLLHLKLPQLVPLALILPGFVMLSHTIGHLIAARLVGGRISRSMLWALGDMSDIDAPMRPGPQFAVAAGGPLITLAMWLACETGLRMLAPDWTFGIWYLLSPSASGAAVGWHTAGWGGAILGFTCLACADVFFWNLLPSVIFDGGRLWRAALWPLLGLARAGRVAVIGSFVASAAMIALGIYMPSMLWLVFGLMMLFASINEHRSMQSGYDLVLGIEPVAASAYAHDRRSGPGWFARWRERRRARQLKRDERDEATEQEILDRLLAKVSAQGLPSLTAGERAELHRISEKQKKRLEHAS